MSTRVLVAAFGALLLGSLAVEILVLSPLRGVGDLNEFYGPLGDRRIAIIVNLMLAWFLVSVAVIVVLTLRLAARTTWTWNRPFSRWRVTRSLLVIVAVVCLGSVIPGWIVGGTDEDTDSVAITDRSWLLLGEVLTVGSLALLLAFVMYFIGAVALVAHKIRERNTGG